MSGPSKSNGDESRVLNLPLSPLEQLSPRRYTRLALAIGWNRSDPVASKQVEDIEKCLADVMLKTMQNWPFLGGNFRPMSDGSSKVELAYPPILTPVSLDRKFEVFQLFADSRATQEYRVNQTIFTRRLFARETDPLPGGEFPPVALRVTFIGAVLVLGFAFSRVIFDGEFIHNFIVQFARNTRSPNLYPPRGEMPDVYTVRNAFTDLYSIGIHTRTIPKAIADLVIDESIFRNGDMNNKEGDDAHRGNALICKKLQLNALVVNDLVSLIRPRVEHDYPDFVSSTDCVLALFWVIIMHARYADGRFTEEDVLYLNIAVAQAFHTRFPRGVRQDYFGNSTVITTAECLAGGLVQLDFDDEDWDLTPMIHPEQLTLAALSIREAMLRVKANSVKSPRAAQAINHHTTGLFLEDWDRYGTDITETLLPNVQDSAKTTMYPCSDDMSEGHIILLPRKDQGLPSERWTVCLCLTQEDMEAVMYRLDNEGWMPSKKVADSNKKADFIRAGSSKKEDGNSKKI